MPNRGGFGIIAADPVTKGQGLGLGPTPSGSFQTPAWINAASKATGGSGSQANPWTSPSGTGGIQEAYAALPTGVLGGVYAPAGYYAITAPINFTANGASIITSGAAGKSPILFLGDGSTNTILVGSTKGQGGYGATIGPIFDLTGTGHNQLRDFALIQGSSNKSTVGILFARSTTSDSQFTQNNLVENVYILFPNDAAANNGNGNIGIYGRSVETTLFVNNEVFADIPYVFTGQDIYSIVSPNQPAGTINSCTQNGIQGGYAAGYYAAVVIQGSAGNNLLSNVTLGASAGFTGLHAIKVLADSSVGSNNIYGIGLTGVQVEQWTGVLSTTAPIHKARLDATYSQDTVGTNPAILLSGANAALTRCEINISNTNAGSVQKLIGDGGATTGGVKGCAIKLGTPLTINAPFTPASGNTINSDAAATPTITWVAPDPAQLVTVTAQQPLVGAVAGAVESTIFTQTADKTVANTVTETTMLAAGTGSLVLPANFFKAGKGLRFTMRGLGGINGGGTISWRAKLGSTNMVSIIAQTPTAFAANRSWSLVGEIYCRTTGGAGTFVGQGPGFQYYTSVGALLGLEYPPVADPTLDTTVSQTFDLTLQFGTASAANTLTAKSFVLEVIGVSA